MAPPFTRRPQLSKTYGSRRTSGGAAGGSSRPSTSTTKSILDDSSDDDTPPAGSLIVHRSTAKAANGKGKQRDKQSSSKPSSASKRPSARPSPPSSAQPAQPPPARRTRSSTAVTPEPAKETEDETDRGGAGLLEVVKEKEGSTVWDEGAALQHKPVGRPTRRKSARGAAAVEGENGEAGDARENGEQELPPAKKRARTSLANGKNAKGKEKEQQPEEDVPAPFDYVPLSERIAKPSPPKRSTSRPPPSAPLNATTPQPPTAPSPVANPTPAAAPSIFPSASTSSLLAKAAAPIPPAPAEAVGPPSIERKPPPSPAKDLSALFSRFSQPASTSASTSSVPVRAGLKRSASAVDAGGLVGRMKSGRRATVDEKIAEESDGETRSTGRASPFPSPSCPSLALDRSLSQPVLPSSPTPSSPLSSPHRSPSRPSLGTSLSFPAFSAAHPFSPSREGSPSRPAAAKRGKSGIFPSYGLNALATGSAYRPATFIAGRGPAPGGGGGGRTYAGAGGRSYKEDVDEQAFFAGPCAAGSAQGRATSSPHSSLLPPSLRRPLLPAPPPPRDSTATLRARWGIDAEESLAALEVDGGSEGEGGSQDRGSKVEGGGLLWKKGDEKKWRDEVDFLVEGMREGAGEGEVGGDGVKASAFELLRKLLDRDWLRRLKASGNAEKVYTALRRAGAGEGVDRVLDTSLALLLALLLRDQRLSEPLFRLTPSDISLPLPSPSPRPSSPYSRPPSPAGGSFGMSRQNSYGFFQASQSQNLNQGREKEVEPSSSFPSFSSSPRKRTFDAAREAMQDDRCDVMEVLRGFLEDGDEGAGKDWRSEEIGRRKEEEEQGGGAGRVGKAKKKERGEVRHLQTLRDIVDDSSLFSSEPGLPVTILSLTLLAIRSLSSFAPRPIFQPQQLLCASGAFEAVVREGLVSECEKIGKRIDGWEKGLDLLPPPLSSTSSSAPSLPTLLLTLSILELTSASSPLAFPSISTPSLLPVLADALRDLTLFSHLLFLEGKKTDEGWEEGGKALVAVLGVLYGLTTEPVWIAALLNPSGGRSENVDLEVGVKRGKGARAEIVATLVRVVLATRREAKRLALEEAKEKKPAEKSARVKITPATSEGDVEMLDAPSLSAVEVGQEDEKDEDSEKRRLWDVLALSLGALANVLDSVGDEKGVKELLRESELNPSCHARRKCARSCTCPGEEKKPVLEILAELAKDPMEDAPNSVYQTSATGFLRLVLGFSMLSSPQNEELVTSVLLSPSSPSASSDDAGRTALSAVLDALEDLAKIQEQQQKLLLGAPPEPGDDEDEMLAETQVEMEGEEVEIERTGDEGEEMAKVIRQLVGRLRRRVESAGVA
ncbi:hypothetical protein JCM8547_003627 [Rhodosporidiobolus lusitaniae]